jgi:holo-[acyl-carrier protein] synthase
MILGHGVDVTEIARIEEALARFGDRFLERTFCAAEIAYCRPMTTPGPHYAARFAAKEAVAKAFGVGIGGQVGWRDVGVTRDAEGRPSVVLHGAAQRLAAERGVTRVHLALSHAAGCAWASVILE